MGSTSETAALKDIESVHLDSSSDEECLATWKKRKIKENGLESYEKKIKSRVESNNLNETEIKIETYSSDYQEDSQFSDYQYVQSDENRDQSGRYPQMCDDTFQDIPGYRYKCTKCGKCYKRSRDFKMHQQFHTDGKYMCDICNGQFLLKVNLARHMIIHERQRYKCLKCQQKFNTNAQLDEHYNKNHLKLKDCPVCKVVFHSIEESHWHVNSLHHGPGTSRCHLCHTDFPTTKKRDDHLKVVHANEIMGCKICGQKYYCGCNEPTPSQSSSPEENKPNEEDNTDSFDDSSEQMYVQCLYDVTVKREDLTHPTQCAIVSKMHKGRSVSDICKLYHLTPEIVNQIWEERDKFGIPKKIGSRPFRYMTSVLDTKILEWFNRQREMGIQITGKMLINVAEEYAKDCGFVAFNGSLKWLDRFKRRHKISLRSTPVKRINVRAPNDAKWKEQFFNDFWPDVRSGYVDSDIFTGDEIGVFYNPSKGRIRKHAGKKYIHGFDKDRLSIFMCTNMTGEKRVKLLVCGADDPLAQSHRNPHTLPVTYIRHSQAHFTTTMFEDFVKTWDLQLQVENKRVLLLLDRASIHSKLPLKNLKLCFVPWKAFIGLMPIKNGIYASFRNEFRKLVLQEKAMNAMRGIDRNTTCLEALELLSKAWRRVPCEDIVSSFEAIGYKVEAKCGLNMPKPAPVTEKDDANICKMLEVYDIEPYFMDLANLDMFLTVDDELLTAQGTNGSVFGGNHKVNDPLMYGEMEKEEILPLATSRDDLVEREKSVLRSRAVEDLDILRKYLEANKTSFETFSAFMDLEQYLLKSTPKL